MKDLNALGEKPATATEGQESSKTEKPSGAVLPRGNPATGTASQTSQLLVSLCLLSEEILISLT